MKTEYAIFIETREITEQPMVLAEIKKMTGRLRACKCRDMK